MKSNPARPAPSAPCRRAPAPAAALLLTLLAALPLAAQPTPAGPPFAVSQAGVATNPAPVVAVGPRGDSVFLWIGECPDFGLCARSYDENGAPLGDAARLATTQEVFDAVPAAVLGDDGVLTAVWSEAGAGFERRIVARRYLLDGTPLGAERTVAARSAQVFDSPALTLTPGGDLLVAFEKLRFDGTIGEGEEEVPVYTGVEILARRLAADGTPRGEIFRVDGPSADVVGAPTVAAGHGPSVGDAPEHYLFAWESFDFLTGRDDVLRRRFIAAADGTATGAGAEAPVASASPQVRRAPTAASATRPGSGGDPASHFLIAWEEASTPASLRAQIYDTAGPIYPFPFEIGQGAGVGNQPGGNRAPRAEGGLDVFAVAWENSAGAVFARRYNADGQPLEERFRVDLPASGTPLHPDVGVFGGSGLDSGLVVGWTLQEPDFDRQILGRRYAGTLPPPEPCVEDATTLCLGDGGRFELTTTWSTAQGTSGVGRQDGLTDDTGYFWFFNEANVEVIAKVLDACAVNGRYWVFAAGLTNVRVTLTVRDTDSNAVRTYENPQGTPFQPIQDTAAFACP